MWGRAGTSGAHRGRWGRWAWILAATTLVGCRVSPVFHCSDDRDCGADGACEGVGYCSFADDECASGRRWGDFAGDDVAGACFESAIAEAPPPVEHAAVDEPSRRRPDGESGGSSGDPSGGGSSGGSGDGDPSLEGDGSSGVVSPVVKPDGVACLDGLECSSGRCDAVCVSCGDGTMNGGESWVDCGGSETACPRCGEGDACSEGSDCDSGDCRRGICVRCDDGVQNGSETDVDCGGACEPCGPGSSCGEDLDCASGACEDGACCGGTRTDCTRCALRLTQLGCEDFTQLSDTSRAQCDQMMACFADHPQECPTKGVVTCRAEPGTAGEVVGACRANLFGGIGGGVDSATTVIVQAAGCETDL